MEKFDIKLNVEGLGPNASFEVTRGEGGAIRVHLVQDAALPLMPEISANIVETPIHDRELDDLPPLPQLHGVTYSFDDFDGPSDLSDDPNCEISQGSACEDPDAVSNAPMTEEDLLRLLSASTDIRTVCINHPDFKGDLFAGQTFDDVTQLTITGVKSLSEVGFRNTIEAFPHLESLKIEGVEEITGEALELTKLPQMTYFEVNKCESFEGRFFEHLLSNSSLNTFIVRDAFFDQESWKYFCDAIQPGLEVFGFYFTKPPFRGDRPYIPFEKRDKATQKKDRAVFIGDLYPFLKKHAPTLKRIFHNLGPDYKVGFDMPDGEEGCLEHLEIASSERSGLKGFYEPDGNFGLRSLLRMGEKSLRYLEIDEILSVHNLKESKRQTLDALEILSFKDFRSHHPKLLWFWRPKNLKELRLMNIEEDCDFDASGVEKNALPHLEHVVIGKIADYSLSAHSWIRRVAPENARVVFEDSDISFGMEDDTLEVFRVLFEAGSLACAENGSLQIREDSKVNWDNLTGEVLEDVKSVSISGREDLTDEMLTQVLESCPNITHLHIADNPNLTGSFWDDLELYKYLSLRIFDVSGLGDLRLVSKTEPEEDDDLKYNSCNLELKGDTFSEYARNQLKWLLSLKITEDDIPNGYYDSTLIIDGCPVDFDVFYEGSAYFFRCEVKNMPDLTSGNLRKLVNACNPSDLTLENCPSIVREGFADCFSRYSNLTFIAMKNCGNGFAEIETTYRHFYRLGFRKESWFGDLGQQEFMESVEQDPDCDSSMVKRSTMTIKSDTLTDEAALQLHLLQDVIGQNLLDGGSNDFVLEIAAPIKLTEEDAACFKNKTSILTLSNGAGTDENTNLILPRMTSLKSLSFINNPDFTGENLEELFESPGFENLNGLFIDNCPKAYPAVIYALKHTGIKHLALNNLSFTEEQWTAIINSVISGGKIVRLDVANCIGLAPSSAPNPDSTEWKGETKLAEIVYDDSTEAFAQQIEKSPIGDSLWLRMRSTKNNEDN